MGPSFTISVEDGPRVVTHTRTHILSITINETDLCCITRACRGGY